MKRIIHYCFFVMAVTIQAQDFKPYKVKSGKIVYEKLQYATHSEFSSINGVESSFSEQIPYIADEVVYYWDDFGDVAFEEVYNVSTFGGKPLSEKIKSSERFWIDEHRYYFDVEKNKVSDNPYYFRIKCRENFQYYQIIGSWIKTQNMGVEASGTANILGKEATYYKIDTSTDLFAWKDLVLKQEDFATTPSGKRLYPDRTKIAVKIDTISKVNDTIFKPVWLKREKLYNTLNGDKITELFDARQDLLFQADNIKGFHIQKNDILLFVTTKLNTGKLQVLNIDENKITIKYHLYTTNGFDDDLRNSFKINNNALVNIDNSTYKKSEATDLDFKYENNIIIPQNNISIYLLKTSRTKSLKLKPYTRK